MMIVFYNLCLYLMSNDCSVNIMDGFYAKYIKNIIIDYLFYNTKIKQ